MNGLRAVKLILGLTIAIFAAAATYTSLTIVQRQNALRDTSRYNVVWATSQALGEFYRFEYRVAAYSVEPGKVPADELLLRFDILHNRVGILTDGEVAAFAAAVPEQQVTISRLAVALETIEPLMARIDQPDVPMQILDVLSPLDTPMTRLAAAANQYGGAQVDSDYENLIRLHFQLSSLAAGLVFCGLLFIALLFYQNRLIHGAHDELNAAHQDLLNAKDAADAANASKSRFLANMSHELRTPLNAIIGFSEMIVGEVLGPVTPPKYREYASDVLNSGLHMTELVSDILTMAKLEAGHYELEREPLPLRDVIESSIAIFRGTEMAQSRDIRMEPSDWPVLHADERAVRQMVLNLLSNAVKFSGDGTPVRVNCRLQPNGDLAINVIDQGIGMTPAEAELVVKPFHQVESTLARRYEGSGLGLSIVASLMERHQGRLLIDSEPGRGSTMSLVFPAISVEVPPADLAADAAR